MQKLFTTFKPFAVIGLLLMGVVMVNSCNDEPDPLPDPIASFQFEVDANNFLQVIFTNFSQNATSYSWDFGDGNTSTEESPTHTYAAAGTYTVALTATNDDGATSTKSETVQVTDPDEELTRLAGLTSRTWYLQREDIALGIGPAKDDNAWWSFGGVTPLADRPCILDDQFTFHRDGTFEFNSNGTIFIDSPGNGGWKETEGCYEETEPDVWTGLQGEDLSAFASGGSYTFDLNSSAGTLTLNGTGAYIGLPNKTAAGDNYVPISVKTYEIFNFVDGDIADSLGIAIVGDGFVWNFYLVHYDDINNLPDIPQQLPNAAYSFEATDLTVVFTNTSNPAAINFSWNFGDGNTSTEESPTHTYAAAGSYDVTLTTNDGQGNEASETKTITVGVALPNPGMMGHTFDIGGADLLETIYGASTIELGVDDPADVNAPKVGKFNRVDTEAFQEAKLTFNPATDIDFSNLTTVTMDVYLPSTNDHTGPLTRTVIIGLADESVNPDPANWWEDHAQYETTLTDQQMDQWVTLTYDLATPNSGANTSDPDTRMDLDMVFINIGGGNHNVGATFYIRNLKFD